jgi:ligand-binding sensor domain-containing protein/signal transduction histidine kinase
MTRIDELLSPLRQIRILLIRLACGLLVLAAPVVFSTRAEEFHVQNWRREDGLPDGQITALEQTADGYLWIGTAKGLARFDGIRFKVFKAGETPDFTDSRISSLTTDHDGTLWVGLLDGNIVRRGEDGFVAMQPAVPLKLRPDQKPISDTWLWDRRTAMVEEAEGTPRNDVRRFADRRAQLTTDGEGSVWWQVSGLSLMRFKAGQWSVFTASNSVPADTLRQVACDHEGRVWFESDGKLQPYNPDRQNSAAAIVTLNGQWAVLTPASPGGLWVAEPRSSWLQEGGRVLRLADGRWHDELSLKPPSPRPASSVITCLLEDHTGRLWCGTASGGIFFSNNKGEWQRLRPQSSFSQGYISCLFEDRQGNLWVGTVGDGLYRVTAQPAKMLTLPPPYENAEINTTCVTRDGAIWMGTGGSGAIRFDGTNFSSFGLAEGLANQHVCALFEDSRTNLWAGTSGGLFRWEAGRFVPMAGPPEMSVWVKALFEDHRGRLWIGTLGGLICYEQGRLEVYHLRRDKGYCDIRCLAEDSSGNLWVGTIGQGLFYLPGGQADKSQQVQTCPALDVRALYYSKEGTLWIGGWGGGLFWMENGLFFNVTTEDGLPSDRIQSIMADTTGRMWLSTDNGLIGLTPSEVQNYRRGISPPLLCQHISMAEGLANGGCSGSGQPVAARTADDRLLFPNYEGVAVLDPQKTENRQLPLRVMVESVFADGKELSPAAVGKWQVSSGVRRFEFDYTAPNLATQPSLHFRHKLVGMDKDWVDVGEQRAAYYSQLPPGNYQFHVMVGGADNKWYSADRVINLNIMPRFWERRWLQVLASALLVAILGGSFGWSQRRKYRLRVERLQMQNVMEDERRRIARDLHDEFGSRLSGIALQGEAATQAGHISPTAYSEIMTMTRRVRGLIGILDEVVWATNPANDSLANVVAYLCDYTEDFLSPTAIHCRLEVPATSELPAITLTAQTRHNLLLATKEALNNSIRHAQAKTIWLKIHIKSGCLVVEIADDGGGFEPTAVRAGGNGLLNFTKRMELIHGKVEIQSQTNQGTIVRLKIPLGITAILPK